MVRVVERAGGGDAERVMTYPKVLIAGLGNVLRGDDGIGPTVAHYLKARCDFDPGVEVVDLGTPGFDLAYHMAGCWKVMLIDAAMLEGEEVGTVRGASLEEMAGLTEVRQDAHSLAIGEALRLAERQGGAPSEVRLALIAARECEMGEKLSAAMVGRIHRIVTEILFLLAEMGVRFRLRVEWEEPWLWWMPERGPAGQAQTHHS